MFPRLEAILECHCLSLQAPLGSRYDSVTSRKKIPGHKAGRLPGRGLHSESQVLMRCNPDGPVGAHTAEESAASAKLRQGGLRGQPAEGPCPTPPAFQATGAESQMSSQAPRDSSQVCKVPAGSYHSGALVLKREGWAGRPVQQVPWCVLPLPLLQLPFRLIYVPSGELLGPNALC